MRHLLTLVAILCVNTSLGVADAAAQPPAAPRIHRVIVHPYDGIVTIAGAGLGPDLQVSVDGQPATVLPGSSDTQLQIVAPAIVLTMSGTYRLTLVDPVRGVGDEFVVMGSAGSVPVSDRRLSDTEREPTTAPRIPVSGSVRPPVREVRATAGPSLSEDNCITAVGLEALASQQGGGCGNTAVGRYALHENTTGSDNTAMGEQALVLNTIGRLNTGVGIHALGRNTTADGNTAIGGLALWQNTTGTYNSAMGAQALWQNTTGTYNTAMGAQALAQNTTGYFNTAAGVEALFFNTTGVQNTASGRQALFSNTTGSDNAALGEQALRSNTTGFSNTASGRAALYANTTGAYNTADGEQALGSNGTGASNTATGAWALQYNTSGGINAAAGVQALWRNTTGERNTAHGGLALASNTTGSDGTAVGFNAGLNATTGSYNVFLGAGVVGTAADANTMRLGLPYSGGIGQNRTFVAGIHGTQLTGPAVQVFVDANGQLGTLTVPIATGTIGAPLGSAAGDDPATIAALRRQVERLEARDAELQARLSRLEAQLQARATPARR